MRKAVFFLSRGKVSHRSREEGFRFSVRVIGVNAGCRGREVEGDQ